MQLKPGLRILRVTCFQVIEFLLARRMEASNKPAGKLQKARNLDAGQNPPRTADGAEPVRRQRSRPFSQLISIVSPATQLKVNGFAPVPAIWRSSSIAEWWNINICLRKFLGQPNRPTSVSNWLIPEKRSARNVDRTEAVSNPRCITFSDCGPIPRS